MTSSLVPIDPNFVAFVYRQSPMAAFMVAEEGIIDDICKMSKVGAKEHEQNQRTLNTHTYKLAVRGSLAASSRDEISRDFLEQCIEQHKAEGKTPPSALFRHKATAKAFTHLFCGVPEKSLASLSVLLTKETQDSYQDNERFLNQPLPESVGLVSEALGLPLDRVVGGTRKTNTFTRGRLIRSFGPNFVYNKPPSFDTMLLPVCSPLFEALCTPGGVLGKDCLPFGAIWVVGDDEWKTNGSPYDLVHRPGVEYAVELRLEELVQAYSAVLKHLARIAGKHDDVI